jgi:hypothetical protein
MRKRDIGMTRRKGESTYETHEAGSSSRSSVTSSHNAGVLNDVNENIAHSSGGGCSAVLSSQRVIIIAAVRPGVYYRITKTQRIIRRAEKPYRELSHDYAFLHH